MCHDLRVPVKEDGPGIGIWISMAIGLVAGLAFLWQGAGLLLAFIVFVVVSIVMAVLIS